MAKQNKADNKEIDFSSNGYRHAISYYFSVNPTERKEIISLLGSSDKESDARELSELFRDCLWRETRFEIINALSGHSSLRGFEALIELLKNDKDLPIAEATWVALGRSSFSLSEVFLKFSFLSVSPKMLQYRQVLGALHQLSSPNYKKGTPINEAFSLKIYSELQQFKAENDLSMMVQLIPLIGQFRVLSCEKILEQIYFQWRSEINSCDELEQKLWSCTALSLARIARNSNPFKEASKDSIKDFSLKQIEYLLIAQIEERNKLETLNDEEEESSLKFSDFPIQEENEWNNYLLALKDNELLEFWVCVGKNEKMRRATGNEIIKRFEHSDEEEVQNRYLRALALYGIDGLSNSRFVLDWVKSKIQSHSINLGSIWYWLERIPQQNYGAEIVNYITHQKGLSTPQAWSALASCRFVPHLTSTGEFSNVLLSLINKKQSSDLKVSLIRLFENHPNQHLELWVTQQLKDTDVRVVLSALAAVKKVSHKKLIPELLMSLEKLLHQTKDASVRGRTLDALCSFETVEAHKILLQSLDSFGNDIYYCEKLLRSLCGHRLGIPLLSDTVLSFIKKYPQHLLIDQFQRLLENYYLHTVENKAHEILSERISGQVSDTRTHEVDRSICSSFSEFAKLDPAAISALRSAEVPFVFPNVFEGNIDKSSSILAYCKVIDLLLEREFGKKLLFPKLERNLEEFQSIILRLGLQDLRPNSQKIIELLGLENTFSVQNFPSHKCYLIGQAILNGKILFEQFKVLDGLRAWAVMLLLFARNTPKLNRKKPLVELKGFSDGDIVQVAKKMMLLQDARNPVAHRQILLKTPELNEMRTEAYSVLLQLSKAFF